MSGRRASRCDGPLCGCSSVGASNSTPQQLALRGAHCRGVGLNAATVDFVGRSFVASGLALGHFALLRALCCPCLRGAKSCLMLCCRGPSLTDSSPDQRRMSSIPCGAVGRTGVGKKPKTHLRCYTESGALSPTLEVFLLWALGAALAAPAMARRRKRGNADVSETIHHPSPSVSFAVDGRFSARSAAILRGRSAGICIKHRFPAPTPTPLHRRGRYAGCCKSRGRLPVRAPSVRENSSPIAACGGQGLSHSIPASKYIYSKASACQARRFAKVSTARRQQRGLHCSPRRAWVCRSPFTEILCLFFKKSFLFALWLGKPS